MTADLRARRLLMAAHLYYDRHHNVMSDAAYDALSLQVISDMEMMASGLPGVEQIQAIRLYQLGSVEDLRASGFHLKFTRATIGGAESWCTEVVGDGYVFSGTFDFVHLVEMTGVMG